MTSTSRINNFTKYNDVLISLQDYMFTVKNLEKYNNINNNISNNINNNINNNNNNISNNISNNNNNINNKIEINKKETIKELINKKEDKFLPKQIDTLFWCFFLMKYGDSAYETINIGNQFFIKEKEEKFKYIDIVRKQKDILKMNKIKPLSEIEDDLANKNKISLKTFIALCIIEKINVIVVNKRKIFESINNDNNNIYLINNEQDKYYIDLAVTNEKINNYRENYYKLDSFESSLKAMSSYKLEELHDLAEKLGVKLVIPADKKKLTKKDIYEQLLQQF